MRAQIDDYLIDNIQKFLDSPPEGTPKEILEAFEFHGANVKLPPRLVMETVEQAPVAISITDSHAKIIYANKAFEELTGYDRNDVIGHNESILSSKSTPISVYRKLWRTIQGKQVWQGTVINHKKNKEEYLAELTISPVLNGNNEIRYFLGMHRDITQMHKLESRLKFQKELTEAALNAAPMVVAMIDSERNVIMDNMAYKALLTDFEGVEPAKLFLDALEQQIGFDLNKYRAGQGFNNVEIELESPKGGRRRWFSCSGSRMAELNEEAQNYFQKKDANRCCLLLVAMEVTAEKRRINEARLNMIRASMAEQQVVQTMREAISAAIYKLQVPLNVIKAALSMSGNNPQQSGLSSALKEALETGDEAMESLHAALPSASIEQDSRININSILHEVVKLSTHRLLSTGVVINWQPSPVLPSLTGRANALRGMFKYLIENAVQAVTESGRMTREVRIETLVENHDLIIKIIDNGAGIKGSQRLKVFEPFYCGWKQPGDHAGMGLTMAQEVAVSHGGSIVIDAEFLGGCCVSVVLPVAFKGGEWS